MIRAHSRCNASLCAGAGRLLAGLLLLLCVVASQGAAAQTILALANGDPITAFDVEQRTKLIKLTEHRAASPKEVLELLIDDRLKIKEGRKFGLDLTSADLDEQYENTAKRLRLSTDQLSKMLESQGIRPQTFKSRIKADVTWSQLVRGRYQQALLVGEKEINSELKTGGDAKPTESGFEYSMRPVVLLVSGDAEGGVDSRRKEAEALRTRVQTCTEAADIFRNLRGGVIRDTVVKSSADIPPALRTLLDTTPIGHLTPPEVTKQGIEMVALCERKPTTIDTPQKREIKEKLFAKKYDAQSKKYLADLRRAAMIEYR